MNEKLKSFIDGVGTLCETWTIIYRSFLSQGMDANEALKHTQGFMTAFMNTDMAKGKKEENDE